MTKEEKDFIDNLYDFSDREDETKGNKKKKGKNNKTKQKDVFDLDTETVIGMTNRNNQKAEKEYQKKMTKQQEKILKKKKKIKRIFRIFLFLALMIGGVIFALVSPLFNIQEINVIDNDRISSDTIISLSQIKIGQNLFKYNRSESEKNIKQEPYIESASIVRKLPNTVEISVVERERNFNVEFINGYFYINNQGYILEISEEKLDLPIIKGINIEEGNVVPGNRLDKADLEKLETAIQIMDICKNYEIDDKISSIDIKNKNNYTLYVEEEQKTIYLGDGSNLSNKMLYLPVLLSENEGKSGEIFLDGDINNNFKPRFKESVNI